MKLIADVVSGSGLAFYAEVALILFVIVFVVVALRVLLSDKRSIDEAARLPLDDDERPRTTTASSTRSNEGSTDDHA